MRTLRTIGCVCLVLCIALSVQAQTKKELQETETILTKLDKTPRDFDGKTVVLTGFVEPDDGLRGNPIKGTKLIRIDVDFQGGAGPAWNFRKPDKGELDKGINIVMPSDLLGRFQTFSKEMQKKVKKRAIGAEFGLTCTIKKQGTFWVAEVTEMRDRRDPARPRQYQTSLKDQGSWSPLGRSPTTAGADCL